VGGVWKVWGTIFVKKMIRFFAWLIVVVKVFCLQTFFCMQFLYKEEKHDKDYADQSIKDDFVEVQDEDRFFR